MNINTNYSPSMFDRVNLEANQNKLENSKANLDDKALMDVCKDFESVFLYMMMQEMKKTVPDGGLIEKSTGSKMFEDMYMEEMSKEISNNGEGIGLAKTMYDQFKSNNLIIK